MIEILKHWRIGRRLDLDFVETECTSFLAGAFHTSYPIAVELLYPRFLLGKASGFRLSCLRCIRARRVELVLRRSPLDGTSSPSQEQPNISGLGAQKTNPHTRSRVVVNQKHDNVAVELSRVQFLVEVCSAIMSEWARFVSMSPRLLRSGSAGDTCHRSRRRGPV
jgi:hypothetical protein